jgi:glutathione S-transferase
MAWRVLLTAEVKGIPYEGKLLASKGELKTPEFLAINPLGRDPALRDGDFTLHESLAIMVYLDRKHPSPPPFRAHCRRSWPDISVHLGIHLRFRAVQPRPPAVIFPRGACA